LKRAKQGGWDDRAWIFREIKWTAINAKGFATYFWSDYLDFPARIEVLRASLQLLERALSLRPNNWATLCNLASAKMRLGEAFRCLGVAQEAEKYLNAALADVDLALMPNIRPNYCFALYERGRILRLLKRFPEAVASLTRARDLPEDLRDVNVQAINAEIQRAEERNPILFEWDIL
jgi:tetratricopeptide (TPR) repeat protein